VKAGFWLKMVKGFKEFITVVYVAYGVISAKALHNIKAVYAVALPPQVWHKDAAYVTFAASYKNLHA